IAAGPLAVLPRAAALELGPLARRPLWLPAATGLFVSRAPILARGLAPVRSLRIIARRLGSRRTILVTLADVLLEALPLRLLGVRVLLSRVLVLAAGPPVAIARR